MTSKPTSTPTTNSTSPESTQACLERAIELHEAWQFEAAKDAYSIVLHQEPTNIKALFGLGQMLGMHMQRSADALPYLEAALGLNPRDFTLWHTYIFMLIREGLLDMAKSLIELARTHGMQEIVLEQLQKEVDLAQGAEASSFLEEQLERLPQATAGRAIHIQTKNSVPLVHWNSLVRLFQAGNFLQASQLAKSLLLKYPKEGLLWKVKAAADNQRGDLMAGIASAKKAIKFLPDDAEAYFNFGGLLLQTGEFLAAEKAMREAIALRVDWGQAFLYLGDAIYSQKRLEESFPYYVYAVLLEPSNIQSLIRLATVLNECGKITECMQILVMLIQQCSDDVNLFLASADILRKYGKWLQAEAAYRKSLNLDPNNFEALSVLGSLLTASGRHQEAQICFKKALAQNSDIPELHCQLAYNFYCQGDYEGALRNLTDLLQTHENHERLHILRSLIYLERHDLVGLDSALKKGLSIFPRHKSLLFMNALRWYRGGDAVKAVEEFDDLLKDNPEYETAQSARLMVLLHSPLVNASKAGDECRKYGSFMRQRVGAQPTAWVSKKSKSKKILRIGFVSADFREHAAAKFFLPVMRELSQRQDMVCVAYFNNDMYDRVTHEFQGLFKLWRSVKDLSAISLERLVREDGIDILFDLSGHTNGQRLDVFALKPAPLQLTWIGHPGSTGLDTMDYIVLSDIFLEEESLNKQVTEKVMRLPMAYVFDGGVHSIPVSGLPALKNNYITFGSFNRMAKINRSVIAVWGSILRALPSSKLIVGACNSAGEPAHLRDWLTEESVDLSRIRFMPSMGFDDYLRAHHEIDICLDTLPYTGGVVTNHALWMGVPTLTLLGELLSGRQSAEVLARVGLAPDFVARNVDEIVQRAQYWQANLPRLAAIRGALRSLLEPLELQQADIVARSVALGLRKAWHSWCEGHPCTNLSVSYEELGVSAPASLQL